MEIAAFPYPGKFLFHMQFSDWVKRKTCLPSIMLLFAALPFFGAPRQNIVLFVADDHGLDAGCYGNQIIKTPSLDRLASEGTRFTNAYCTTASCSASRSVLLTGLHNHLNGQYGHQHAYHNFHTKLFRAVSARAFWPKRGFGPDMSANSTCSPSRFITLRLISAETREANATRS